MIAGLRATNESVNIPDVVEEKKEIKVPVDNENENKVFKKNVFIFFIKLDILRTQKM